MLSTLLGFVLATGDLPRFLSAQSDFKYQSFSEIVHELKAMVRDNQDIVEVFSAQARFKIPAVSSKADCDSLKCEHWVVVLHEKAQKDRFSPEVFFSGNIHGNEVVGPATTMEWLRTMIKGYRDGDPYISFLIQTRTIVVMPVTNPSGYARGRREEHREDPNTHRFVDIDPNRDFPYNRDKGNAECMHSVTAQALNEVYRDNVFQLAITFHGGMVAIAYEWGSFNHKHSGRCTTSYTCNNSPDHRAEKQLGSLMATFGGGVYQERHRSSTRRTPYYEANSMNDIVYPVNGGMEDWAYASSWDTSAVTACKPSIGSYPEEKTHYDEATLRCLNTLVEAADDKRPDSSTLGKHLSRSGNWNHNLMP